MQNIHLFFLVHGLGGNPGHLRPLEEALKKQVEEKDKAVMHVAKSNSGFKTMDGAVLGANRLLTELLELIADLAADGQKVVRLSFLGYSFGGILARYIVGLLEELGVFDTIEPCIFTTIATPHLGSVFTKPGVLGRFGNAAGPVMLGITGKDLFWKNNVIKVLADPDQIYFKGLRRFKVHLLFANATFDRTVPFWTSYITNKNPFYRRNHLDLRYFDHVEGGGSVHDEGRVPFIVDMKNSRYSKTPTNEFMGLSPAEKRQRAMMVCLLPVFLPVFVALLSFGSISAHIKHKVQGSVAADHMYEWEKAQRALSSNSRHSGAERARREIDEDLASVVGAGIDDVLVNSNQGYGNGPIQASQITKGPALPMLDNSGLESEVPWDCELDSETERAMASLNTLGWRKYAVKLRSMHSHAAIIDRRRQKAQGAELVKFYARLVDGMLGPGGEVLERAEDAVADTSSTTSSTISSTISKSASKT